MKRDFEEVAILFNDDQLIYKYLDFKKFSNDLKQIHFDSIIKLQILEEYKSSLNEKEFKKFKFYYENYSNSFSKRVKFYDDIENINFSSDLDYSLQKYRLS